MNLNLTTRQNFVDGVMNDVPKVDYRQEITDLINKDINDASDKSIRDALKNTVLRPMLISGNSTVNVQNSVKEHKHGELSTFGYSYYHEISSHGMDCRPLTLACYPGYKMSKGCADACFKLMKMNQAQEESMSEIRTKVKAAIAGCRTRKAALATMPEFEKYLPEVVSVSKYPIAIANLAADLIKAGWPKGGKKVAV